MRSLVAFASVAAWVAIALPASAQSAVTTAEGAHAGKSVASPDGAAKKSARAATKPTAALPPGMHWHTVHKGQRLGKIAKRYRVSIAALCHANDILRREKLQPGTKLVIPSRSDGDGSRARAIRLRVLGLPDRPTTDKIDKIDKERSNDDRRNARSEVVVGSWTPYVETPKKKGWISIQGKHGEWKGQLLSRAGKVVLAGRRGVERILAANSGEEAEIDPKLLLQLARISDTFGGRTIQVVSGYRTVGSAHSRHNQGKALDFTVLDVPLEVLRDFCKTFDDVGVGYYPNSGFVHLDVRDRWAYWVDESRRGEPPRYTGVWGKPGADEVEAR